MELGEVIDKLYESELNCRISTEFDAGMRVQLGDVNNGFVAETWVRTTAEAAAWLDAKVRRCWPHSYYCGGKGYWLGQKSEEVN